MKFTDTHTHLYSKEFDEDLEQVIERSIQSSVHRLVVPSTSSKDHEKVAKMVKAHDGAMFAAYGLHPTEIGAETEMLYEEASLELAILSDAKTCAIGEVGLDRYWSDEFLCLQKEALRVQFDLSIQYNLPLIIHVRDAFDDMIDELKPYKGKLRGVFHGYSGSVEQYETLLSYGDFYFGIGGVVTFKNSMLPSVVSRIDISRIVLETDSPYLTPTPYRGKRNESCYVSIIAKKVAEIKGVTLEQLSVITENNCNKLFNF